MTRILPELAFIAVGVILAVAFGAATLAHVGDPRVTTFIGSVGAAIAAVGGIEAVRELEGGR